MNYDEVLLKYKTTRSLKLVDERKYFSFLEDSKKSCIKLNADGWIRWNDCLEVILINPIDCVDSKYELIPLIKSNFEKSHDNPHTKEFEESHIKLI